VSPRHPVTRKLELPELTPTEAAIVWRFLDDLATSLWDVYDGGLLRFETQGSAMLPEDDWADPPEEARPRQPTAPFGSDNDPDF
jgi:hypothetical protein